MNISRRVFVIFKHNSQVKGYYTDVLQLILGR